MDLAHTASIVEASPAAVGHALLRLEAPDGFGWMPGQYVMARLPGDESPRPLALAGLAKSAHLELLVRTPDDARDAFLASARGGEASLSHASGPGWSLDALEGREVWCVGVGSGISALRPAMDSLTSRGAKCGLVYGVRDPSYLCFADDHDRWRAKGAQVELVFSGEGERVQAGVAELVPEGAVCLLVGMREMVDATKAALKGVVADDDLRLNF